MYGYVFFDGAGKVVHVMILDETAPDTWADDFAKRKGYASWQSTDATDLASDSEAVDAMYADAAGAAQ